MFSEIKHSHFMCSQLRVRLSLRSTRYQYGSHMFYLSTKFNQQVYFKENNSAIPSNTALSNLSKQVGDTPIWRTADSSRGTYYFNSQTI